MKKRNLGLLYIHTKFLKRDNGFANYKLFDGYNKRFCRKYKKYLLTEIIGMKELYHIISPNMIKIILSFFHIKYKFLVKRNIMIQREIKKMNLLQFLNNNIANWHESLKLTNNIKIKEWQTGGSGIRGFEWVGQGRPDKTRNKTEATNNSACTPSALYGGGCRPKAQHACD